ncbi:hypothetical protein ESB00_11015 [Oleiharenicola lentus]|uniref:TonB-dependent receptor n=1 Tax=Oleiharenicola lentus TaxID=2508720 RepID=A0A4Q1CBL9_9BACT|nr:hypothetical protein [Oleiharenicola lentus]RXK56370.1 hypothetical protein ESB00_11015 [Oleiharenicola lentus]
MHLKHNRRRAYPVALLAALALLAQSASLIAQTAPAPAAGQSEEASKLTPEAAKAAAEKEESVLELSPFTVTATEEEGWVATKSLAGSRLKTELKDIAAPVEVLTMEFMNDFALTSAADAAIYTTNVEGAGDNLELGPGAGFGTGFPPPTRVRGLRDATNSREFFESFIPSDNYNLDRVTIASGPNNLLFGSGSPAGTIDSTLKRAQFRDFARVDLQFDSNKSQRYAFDVNQDIIKDKIALRVSHVTEKKNYEYEPAGYDHERYYGALMLRPFKKTTISLHAEKVKVQNIRPQLLLPFDKVSAWSKAGSITSYTHGVNNPIFHNPAAGATWNNAVINNTIWERHNNNVVFVHGATAGSMAGKAYDFNNTVQIKSPKDLPGVDPLNNEADGYTFLDGTYIPVDVDIAGAAKGQKFDADIYNIFITQQIGDNLFIEAAASKESVEDWNVGMGGYIGAYTVHLDSNKFMADGVTANPNAGKMYIQGDPFRTQTLRESEDWRVSASYEFDFLKKDHSWWRNVLGRQRLAALISSRESSNRQQEFFPRIIPVNGVDPVITGHTFTATTVNGWANNSSRIFNQRYYLDTAAGDYSPKSYYDLFGPSYLVDANGKTHVVDMLNTGLTDPEGRRLGNGRTNSFIKSKFDTKQLSYQGFFWNNRLVATLGWREDSANSTGAVTKLDPFRPNPTVPVSALVADTRTGLLPLLQDVAFAPYNSANEQSGTTRTRGFVARPLRDFVRLPLNADISVAWNRSNTFQPDVSNLDPFGNRVKGATGEGEDKSIRLDLMEGKFSVRYTEFENSDGPARAGNVPFNRFRFDLSSILNRVMTLANGSGNTPITGYTNNQGFNTLGSGDPYWVASFRVASGKEWGMDWQVTKNFQLRFNMNTQDVTESDIGLPWWEWLDLEIPKYQALTFPEGGISNPRDLNSNGVIDTWNWNTAWISDSDQRTVAQRYDEVVIRGANGKDIIQSLDGRPNEFVRENRYNVNWMYRFSEGRLKGLSVGGAFRHRAAPVLSFNKKLVNGIGALDIENPFYGKEENLVDLSFNYRRKLNDSFWGVKGYNIGLNIRNVLDDSDLYDKLINVSGVAVRRAKPFEGRTFILSMGFDL